MAQDAKRRTFRVQQLPSDVRDRHQAINLLVRLEPRLGPGDGIRMAPVAASPDIWQKPALKTATFEFLQEPVFLSADQSEWILPAKEHGFSHNVILDTHFLGFTALNDPPEELHDIDCIAISGLASHPFGSWARRSSDGNFMWVRDDLPHTFPRMRCLIYGYDTALIGSHSIQTIDHLAGGLVQALRSIGRSSLSARPLLFLAHSLGGIILKRAIVMLANWGGAERFMLESIRAMICFGVPHGGMNVQRWPEMVAGQPNLQLVDDLAFQSPYLSMLDKQFSGIAKHGSLRLISIFETKMSRTVQQVDGKWSRSGPFELIASPASAIFSGSKEVDCLAIDEDHSNIVKFQEGDHKYKTVLTYIHEVYTSVKRVGHSWGHGEEQKSSATDRHGVSDSSENLTANVDQQRDNILDHGWDIIRSLRIDHSTSSMRFDDIEDAFGHTFDWIFTDTTIGFKQWLEADSGLFWISGKPASGKSTLMKSICNDPRIDQLLETKASGKLQITARYFFHNRGNHYQKSFEGLFRTLITDILEADGRLRAILLPDFRSRPRSLPVDQYWSLKNLQLAFQKLTTQRVVPLNITLFLDALDEFDGRPEIVASFIEQLHQVCNPDGTSVQVCFSSRPWNAFQDAFATVPGFALHDHTETDIRAYVSGLSLRWPSAHRQLILSTTLEPSSEHTLLEQIVTKAQGVFLWVKLTMEELRIACSNGTAPDQLSQLLSHLPDELQDYYGRVLQFVSSDFQARSESYTMFEVVLRSEDPLSVDEFADAVSCGSVRTFEECSKLATWSMVSNIKSDNIKRRLKHLCGGLIEVSVSSGAEQVQFMHQTVKDFISSPQFLAELVTKSPIPRLSSGFQVLTQYHIVAAHHQCRRTDPELHLNGPDLCQSYAYLSELATGMSQSQFLDGVPEVVFERIYAHTFNIEPTHATRRKTRGFDAQRYPINSRMSFAVVGNLQIYVEDKLRSDRSKLRNPNKPLLHCAVEAAISGESGIRGESSSSERSNMVRILLNYGADLSERFLGWTPFQLLLYRSKRGGSRITPNMLKLAEALLDAGQNPNEDIFTNTYWEPEEPFRCRAIHTANLPLIQLLLVKGADVNALDQGGRTALDISYSAEGAIFELGDHRLPEEACEKTLLLLQHGGCVTEASTTYMFAYEDSVVGITVRLLDGSIDEGKSRAPRGWSYQLDARLRNPPLLSAQLQERVKHDTSEEAQRSQHHLHARSEDSRLQSDQTQVEVKHKWQVGKIHRNLVRKMFQK